MDSIGSEKPVCNTLFEAVRIKWIAEVLVGIAVVFTERSCRHSQLIGWLEVFQNFTPTTFIVG